VLLFVPARGGCHLNDQVFAETWFETSTFKGQSSISPESMTCVISALRCCPMLEPIQVRSNSSWAIQARMTNAERF
jgi:hypothetical protein